MDPQAGAAAKCRMKSTVEQYLIAAVWPLGFNDAAIILFGIAGYQRE